MDENISQQPIEANIVPFPEPVKKKGSSGPKGLRGALTDLPQEIKDDMENQMREFFTPLRIKRYMTNKYGIEYPKLKEVGSQAYGNYYKKFNVKASKELSLQKQAAAITPEIKDVIDKITDYSISIEDKRKALTALFDSCEARSKLLQERQTTFVDPNMEALILANRKEQHAILKTVATLSDQLSKDADKDWLEECSTLVQVILSSVVNTYRLTHENLSNFSIFNSTLSQNLEAILKNYVQAKERIKLDKK